MKQEVLAQELVGDNYTLQQEINHYHGSMHIKGYIDYIDDTKIVDVKTYSNDYQFNQMLEKYKRQLLTYGLAYLDHELYILAVQVDDYPQCKVYRISKDTQERETPVLLDFYTQLHTAKSTGLFWIQPQKTEVQEI